MHDQHDQLRLVNIRFAWSKAHFSSPARDEDLLKSPQRHAEVAEGQTHLLIGLRPAVSKFNAANPVTYGVEIRPLLVATIRRFPQRKIDSTRPTPGIMSPLDTSGCHPAPSKITPCH